MTLYIGKFENALLDLDNLETPYVPMMAKINFWSKIEDKLYKIIKKTLGLDDYNTYIGILMKSEKKMIKVEEVREKIQPCLEKM